ncbi:MAG: hypothetical protein K2I32_06070 [Alistipes sp.]|nr:hypothetical protein [Alistipes sp.]
MLHTPASGYRNRTTGDLTSVGDGGWCWSSSSYAAGDTGASQFGLRSYYMYPMYSNNRTYAFPVRCVQHLRAAFIYETRLWE